MANKPLQSIKFPGLPDVYTIESGLSDAAKEAILACFQRVAWTTEEGQQLYSALYDSFYPDVRIVSLSAVFTQGGKTIYTTDSLDTLKQNLVVTATYYSGTTAQISDYVLSGELTAGTSIITAIYGGKTATFSVEVTGEQTNLLYNWDFTKSLVDTVSGLTAETTATRDSNGITFTEPNKYLDLGTVYSRNRTYEIDISYIGEQYPSTSLAYRRIFAFGENGADTSKNTVALPLPKKYSDTEWAWYTGSGWDTAMATTGNYSVFDGKTVKIYVDSNGYAHVSSKPIGASDSAYTTFGQSEQPLNGYSTSNVHVYAGGISDALGNARILAYRIYEGEK